MKETLLQWQLKIDAMSQRERVLLLAVGLVVSVMLIQIIFIDPVMADRELLSKQINQLKQQIETDKNEKILIAAQITAGVNRKKTQHRDQLKDQVAKLNEKIENSLVAMIPPRLMPEVLESMLSQSGELKLVSLENKPVVSVLEQVDEKISPGTSPTQALYNHGFTLRLRGSYMATIQYFENLSKLPWRFHWDVLEYNVEQYPNATITLEVHTVSMSEEWIGV